MVLRIQKPAVLWQGSPADRVARESLGQETVLHRLSPSRERRSGRGGLRPRHLGSYLINYYTELLERKSSAIR
jgi:hypothetical protein